MNFVNAVQVSGSVVGRPRRPRLAAWSAAGCAPCQRFHLCAETIATPGALLLGVRADGCHIRQRDQVLEQAVKGRIACRAGVAENDVAGVRRDSRVGCGEGVVCVAGPAVMLRHEHHARSHRVEPGIAIAGLHVAVAVDQAGLEPPFPKRAGAVIACIEGGYITTAQRLHHLRRRARLVRRDQQMHVVCHKNVGMQGAVESLGGFAELLQVAKVVTVCGEARLAVNATLDHVLRYTGQVEAGQSSHGRDECCGVCTVSTGPVSDNGLASLRFVGGSPVSLPVNEPDPFSLAVRQDRRSCEVHAGKNGETSSEASWI